MTQCAKMAAGAMEGCVTVALCTMGLPVKTVKIYCYLKLYASLLWCSCTVCTSCNPTFFLTPPPPPPPLPPSALGEPCGDKYCFNGGRCASGSCECTDSYTGDYCQYRDCELGTSVNNRHVHVCGCHCTYCTHVSLRSQVILLA